MGSSNLKAFVETIVMSRYLTTYLQVVNFSVAKYPTEEILPEMESAITRSVQPARMNSLPYAGKLVTKTIRCEDVFEKYSLNEIFIGGLDLSLSQSLPEYPSAKKKTTLNHLALHATSLLSLQGREVSSKRMQKILAGQAMVDESVPTLKVNMGKLLLRCVKRKVKYNLPSINCFEEVFENASNDDTLMHDTNRRSIFSDFELAFVVRGR